MAKDDTRYKEIYSQLQAGKIKTVADIFSIIPPTVAAEDTGINYRMLKKKIKSPELFSFEDTFKMADLIGWDRYELLMFFFKETINPSV